MALKSGASIETTALIHTHAFRGPHHVRHEQRMRWVAALSLGAFAVEAAGGVAFGSMALLGEALHTASHAGVFVAAAYAYAYARRHADDPRFSFGPGKVGDLTGFGGAILLAGVALLIAVESLDRLAHPGPVALDQAISLAMFGLAVSAIGAWLVRDAPHAAHGKGVDREGDRDLTQRAAYLHLVGDVLVSALAVLGLLGARVGGWSWLDPAAGLAGSAVVARFAWTLGREAGARLLDIGADPALLDTLRTRLEADGDKVVDLHVWRLAPGHEAAIVSIATAQPQPRAVYAARIAEVRLFSHLTVEVHPATTGPAGRRAPAPAPPASFSTDADRKPAAKGENPPGVLAQAG